MKFYKIENNKFMGFYDSEIHDLYNVTYKEEKKEVEEVTTDEEGNEVTRTKIETIQVPIYTLKANYFELSEEKWTELLNGQSEGKEIKILKNGELGLFEKPQPPKEFYRPVWNESKEVWEEGATEDNLMDERVELMKKYRELKKEIAMLKEEGELDPEFASPRTIEKKEKELKEVRNKIIELKNMIESLEN